MKAFLTLTLILGSQLVFADSIDIQIRDLARKINLSARASNRLSVDEKIQVLKALNNADSVLERVAGDRPGPRPRPLTCENEGGANYYDAIKKVKEVAYSSSGLNLGSSDAEKYATGWATRNSCSETDKLVSDIKVIKAIAYSSAGLNLSSSEASAYAADNAEKVCPNADIDKTIREARSFAYSPSGLNMSSSDASRYAAEQAQRTVFACGSYR